MQSNAPDHHHQPPQQPPKRPKPVSARAAVAALRAELQIELQNKKQCSYRPYECTQLSLDGYNYCARHILEEKGAPFRQCSYVYTSSGKKCHLPAPRGDKREHAFRKLYPRKHISRFCNEHALKSAMHKNRQGSRCPLPQTAEVLLTSLTHYIKKPKARTISSSTQHSDEGRSTPDDPDGPRAIKPLDPFVDLDASALQHTACHDVLDRCSESDSDVEPSTYANVWHDAQADSSDDESIDSEQEDPLKHANVYTAEEITSVTRDKLVRLQELYIEEYKYLQHVLREQRRKYLHSLKKEKENCCSITNQVRTNPKEEKLYKKIKAYNSYHKKHGVEAILNKKVQTLRMKKMDATATKPPTYTKCSFTEGGIKCCERALPVARHCRKHILQDSNQVLFKPCGKICGDIKCATPVEAIFENTACRIHMDIPPIRSYNQVRKDSESDYDDSVENQPSLEAATTSSTAELNNTTAVKAELIDYSLPAKIPEIEKIQSVFGKSFPFEDNGKESTPNENLEIKQEVEVKMEQEEEKEITQERLDIKDEEVEKQMETNNVEAEIKECTQENDG